MSTIRQTYQRQLDEIHQQLLQMGEAVEGMLADGLRAVVEQDRALAEEVVQRDDWVDHLDALIEDRCIHLIATQQPVAVDLRFIATAMKAITDLERIGDYSLDVAKSVRVLAGEPYFKPLEDFSRLGQMTRQLLRDSLQALMERSVDRAIQVCRDDEAIDALYQSLRDELMDHMRRESAVVTQATYLILAARYLERIADHAVNVAERVVYAVTGEFQDLAKGHRPEAM